MLGNQFTDNGEELPFKAFKTLKPADWVLEERKSIAPSYNSSVKGNNQPNPTPALNQLIQGQKQILDALKGMEERLMAAAKPAEDSNNVK